MSSCYQVCPEIDSLVTQLASGKGEFFDYIDDVPSQVGELGPKPTMDDKIANS